MKEQIDRYKGWRHELPVVEAQLAEHKRASLLGRVHCPAGARAYYASRQTGAAAGMAKALQVEV